jgi:3-methyladenine DNA glycosylase AlkD
LCDKLWNADTMEEGTIVCHVYRRFAPHCGTCEFKLFERWVDRYVHNWAHCDGVSTWLIAASLSNDASLLSKLPAWTESLNVWKRRSAAVSLLQEAKRGANTELILNIASRLSGDANDMVQKGVGWVLKETYPRRPREVVSFLRTSQFPRLVLRYAAEKMTAIDRTRVLGS